jgi:hypothetical protein
MLTQELLPDVRLKGGELETPAPVTADNEVHGTIAQMADAIEQNNRSYFNLMCNS